MKKTALTLFFGFLFGFIVVAYAAEPNITFPIPELGNCKNKTECKAYCDKKENAQACISFAKSHGLLSQRDADKARKLRQLPEDGGPGGCKDVESCKTFCQAPENTRQCIQFAQEHGLMDEKEAQEANKILSVLEQRGIKMPGGCTSKQSCEAFCHVQAHFDECLTFAKSAGFISEQQARVIKQTQGKGPGGCQGDACKDYCADQAHFQECVAFAKEHGLISDKEEQMMEKTHGKGPGGCTSQEECRKFCSDPANREVCMSFAREHGLIDEQREQQDSGDVNNDTSQQLNENHSTNQNGARRIPEPVVACMRKNLGDEVTDKFLNIPGEPPTEIRDKMPACYDEWSKIEEQSDIQQHQQQTTFNRTIPESVMACLRQSVGEEIAQKIAQGQTQLEGDLKLKMQACFVKNNQPNPKPTENTAVSCPRVLTFARNPESNVCQAFVSPCAVPPRWIKVTRCAAPNLQGQENHFENQPSSSSSTLQRFGATLIHALYFFVGGK